LSSLFLDCDIIFNNSEEPLLKVSFFASTGLLNLGTYYPLNLLSHLTNNTHNHIYHRRILGDIDPFLTASKAFHIVGHNALILLEEVLNQLLLVRSITATFFSPIRWFRLITTWFRWCIGRDLKVLLFSIPFLFAYCCSLWRRP
jgi:hypothetical protein